MGTKEFKSILIVGTASPHLNKFVKMIVPFFEEIVVISDGKFEMENVVSILTDFHYSIKNNFKTTSVISNQIKKQNPQFVHIHQLSSNSYYTVKACKQNNYDNIISTAWGSDVLLTPRKNKIFDWILKYVLKYSKAITANSDFMFTTINNKMPQLTELQEKIVFGIEPKPIQYSKENIIYSNRLHNPLYRIDKIIIAFNKFISNPNNQEFKLVVAGAGSETDELKLLVSSLNIENKVEFVGWLNQEENAAYFQKAKMYVSIPKSDGAAVSLLEAMYYKCLPIVSNLPSTNEWIKNGVNGIIVKDVDEDFIVSTFKNIELGLEHNFNIIKEQGTFDIAKEKYLDLYKRVLNHAN